MLKGITILILFLSPVIAHAQQTKKTDSLLHILVNEKDDTGKVITLLRVAKNYEANNQDSSIYYLEKARDLSVRLKYTMGVYEYYQQLSIVSFTKGDYDKAMEENYKALSLARQLKDSDRVIIMLNHIGIVYGLRQDFKNQLDYALQVTKVVEAINDSSRLSGAYHNLANCYNMLLQNRKSADFALLSVRIYSEFKKRNDYINRVYATLGQAYQGIKMPDSAIYYFDLAIKESVKKNDKYAEATIYGYESDLFATLGRFTEMLKLSEKSLAIANELQSREMLANALRSVANANFLNGNNAAAKKYINDGLEIAIKDSLIEELDNFYAVRAGTAARDADYTAYISAIAKTDSIRQVVINNQLIKSTAELEKKYETEKKDDQLKLQQDQLQRKNILNDILIGSAIIILIISLLAYRNYKQKQRIQQQRISELEKDKLLVAVDSMLKGQEEERSRLAKDLHDGLGGLLSGVKFSLINMKDNLIITPENMVVFERSLDMIDTSIKELRRVAHNMMPEILTKFGLDEALKEYCNSINATKLLNVKYQSLGMETGLENSVEIIIYRIVQELLNNTMKHAGATESFVQLIREANRLSIVVEDNGKGFDATISSNKDGAGLANVRSRVDYLKGRYAIDAEPGKGTLVNIELNV